MKRTYFVLGVIVFLAVCYFILSKAQTAVSKGTAIQQNEAPTQTEVDAAIKDIQIPH